MPYHKVTSVTDLESLLMTRDRYQRIKAELDRVIQGHVSLEGGKAMPFEAIRKAISESEVPNWGGQHSPSSAMCPVASKWWIIGMFGSVWLDVKVDNKLFRVEWKGSNSFQVNAI